MKIVSVFIIFFIHLIMVPVALSEISVYDIVTISGRAVMLRAETKAGFFAEGGSLVEFFINGRSIGKNLSGGDGIAFKPFVPVREGTYKLRVWVPFAAAFPLTHKNPFRILNSRKIT
jgi:hypothetical protein